MSGFQSGNLKQVQSSVECDGVQTEILCTGNKYVGDFAKIALCSLFCVFNRLQR
jgi:hypothetical protein